MKIVIVDYQNRDFVYCDEETEYLQNVKKAIQLIQNQNNSRDSKRKYKKRYSISLLTLASFLKKQNIDVGYVILPDDEDMFRDYIKDAEFVYFWAMTDYYQDIENLIKFVKSKYNVSTILGGYHVLSLSDSILNQLPELDYIHLGNSEHSVLKLVLHEELDMIAGIAYRKSNLIIKNNDCSYEDNDEIVELDYSFLHGDKRLYRYALQTTSSCPFRCHYCIFGYFNGKVRYKNITSLKNELIQIRAIVGNKLDMHILDNIITYDLNIIEQLTRVIHELGMEINFSADIRAEYLLDINRIKVMSKLGIKQLFIGFEDAEEICRNAATRTTDEAMLVNGLKFLKENSNIIAECYWMMGMPGTKIDSFNKNIKFAVKLIETGLIESICTDTIYIPLPGTPMFDNAFEYGIEIVETNWRLFKRSNYMPVFSLSTITRDELRDGLVRFDKAIIDAQLKILGMTTDEILNIYYEWLNT